MALKTTHAAGEPIKAVDMNSVVTLAIQNAHNIFELFLENFFATKITPFLGLFFDGFSDETKADTTATTLTAGASSGQAILTVASTAGFKVGQNINIFDTTNLDEKVIQSIDSDTQITLTTNLDNTYIATDDVKRTTANIDTTGRVVEFPSAAIGDDKKAVYYSKLQSFQTAMTSVRLWITRSTSGINTNSIDLEKDSSQSLSITDAAQTGLGITGDMTVELWVNLESLVVNQVLVNKWNSPANQRSFSFFLTSGGVVRIFISDDGTDANTSKLNAGTTTLSTGVWTHVAIVYDASAGGITLYINGSPDTQTTGHKTSIFDSNGDFAIGDIANDFDFFDGKIDEVRVWNVIRTSSEINDNFEKELIGNEANLQGYWRLNNSLLDATSNDNDLTNNNAAIFSTDVPFSTGFSIGIDKFNLDAGISSGATTLTILGDQTGRFANGDIIDISTSDNLVRERKTLTATPSFGGGVTTLTFSATTNAFTTSAFVERVDILPQISIVDKDASESFSSITFVRSVVDFINNEVEDEYLFEPSTPNEDVTVKLELTREDSALLPIAKRLGVVLIE